MSSFKQIESGDATPDLPSGSGESRETKPAKRRRVKRDGKTEPGGAAKKEAGGQTKRPREGRKRGRPGQDGVAPQIEDNVAHDEGSPPKSTDGSPSLTDRKAARKAARQLKKKKAARKLKKTQSKGAGETGSPPQSPDNEKDHSAKTERRRRRKKRENRSDDPEGGAEDDLAGDALADEEENDPSIEDAGDGLERPRKRDRLASPLATIVVADNEPVSQRLFSHLQKAFAAAGIELISTAGAARLVVTFASANIITASDEKPIIVVVGDVNAGQERDMAFAKVAIRQQGLFVPVAFLGRRLRLERLVDAHGSPSDDSLIAIAADIRDAVLISERDALPLTAKRPVPKQDVSEVNALAASTSRLLQAIGWPASSPPVSTRSAMDMPSIEAFLEGKIRVRDGGTRMLSLPLEERPEFKSRGAARAVYGLDFLSGVLGYWLQKANKVSSKRVSQIDAAVKERSATASTLLTRAGQTLAEFLRKPELLPETAWSPLVAMRRARAMELYLLCCRAAAQRRIKFDERNSAPVFRALIDTLERLRPAATSALGTAQGVSRAAHIAGLALPLRQTTFGSNLLNDVLQALEIQLELGLLGDGVWHEGFSQHATVFETLRNLSADLRTAGISSEVLAGTLTKMAEFTSEYLRDDGYSPSLAGLAPAKFRLARATAQSLLRSRRPAPGAPGESSARSPGLFPHAGFFVSRSLPAKDKPSSHFVLQAAPAGSGGPSLSFSWGTSQLLIGGGTASRKAPAEARRANSREPGAHNAICVNGLSYRDAANEDLAGIAIDATWNEKNWAAVRMANRAFAPVTMTRTAIHLKPLHALLVVDELFANGDAAKFEQFWHLAPGLEVREKATHRFFFALPDTPGGGLSVVFDGAAPSVLTAAGPDSIGWTSTGKREVARNPYFVRRLLAKKGAMAAFFRCTGNPGSHALTIVPAGQGWKAVLSGERGKIGFVFQNGQLKPAS